MTIPERLEAVAERQKLLQLGVRPPAAAPPPNPDFAEGPAFMFGHEPPAAGGADFAPMPIGKWDPPAAAQDGGDFAPIPTPKWGN